jgi:hypothetical protein
MGNSKNTFIKVMAALLLSVTASAQASALKPVKFCIWDPVGKTGPFSTFLQQAKPAAMAWGVDLQLESYGDEKVAANDFKSGLCDAVFLRPISWPRISSRLRRRLVLRAVCVLWMRSRFWRHR